MRLVRRMLGAVAVLAVAAVMLLAVAVAWLRSEPGRTFLRGRLLMHGAPADTAVTAVENASRPDQRVIATTLIELPGALAEAGPEGPVVILYGLAPRAAAAALAEIREAL